jgi:hypothetical protein
MAVHCQCYPVFFLLSKGFFLWIRATDTSNLGWMVYRRLPACRLFGISCPWPVSYQPRRPAGPVARKRRLYQT